MNLTATAAPVSADAGTQPAITPSKRRLAELILAAPALLLTITAVLRWVFGRAAIDIVVFDQGLWAASRGMEPLVSVIRESLLEDHFGPGILSFAALYRLVASPIWLLAGQGLAAWAAARLIARRLQPALGEIRSAVVGAVLLVSPPIAYAVLFDVHSVVFAVPFAVAALFALEDDRPWRAGLFGLLAALFRVEVGLGVALAFAAWPGTRRGRLRPAILLSGYLVIAFYCEKALGHDSYWAIHYGHLGASASEALAHPLRVVRALVSLDAITKALPWLASGAFLAFRSPRRMVPAFIIALPVLLSQWPGTGSVVFQYGFAPTFLLAAAWVPSVMQKPDWSRHVIGAGAVMVVLLGPVIPPLASGDALNSFAGRYWVPDTQARCIVSGIPAEAGVSASQPLTLLAHRKDLYLWPYPFLGTPRNTLPAEHMAHGDPVLAGRVDYLVIPRGDEGFVPNGFVPDGESDRYVRFRREASTSAAPANCS